MTEGPWWLEWTPRSPTLDFDSLRSALRSRHDEYMDSQARDALLTREEGLVLYRRREDVRPDDRERALLFRSILANGVPAWYWIGADMAAVRTLTGSVIEDQESHVRAAAVRVDSLLGSREELPQFERFLTDPDWKARRAALLAYQAYGSRSDLERIAPLIDDEDEDVSRAAAGAFAAFAGPEDARLLDRLRTSRRSHRSEVLTAILRARGDPAKWPRLLSVLVNTAMSEVDLRDAMGAAITRADLPLLKAIIREEDNLGTWVEDIAEELLVDLAKKEDREDLMRMFYDKSDSDLSWAAARALRKLGVRREDFPNPEEVIRNPFTPVGAGYWRREDAPVVRRLLEVGDPWERARALKLLAAVEPEVGLEAFRPHLDDHDQIVKDAAAEAIEKVATPADLPALVEIAGDEGAPRQVRHFMRLAIAKNCTREHLDLLIPLLSHDSHDIRTAAVETFARLYSDADAHYIEALDSEYGRRSALDLVVRLRKPALRAILDRLLAHPDDYTRAYAVKALAKVGTKADRSILLRMTRDPGSWVQLEAIRALERFTDSPEDLGDVWPLIPLDWGYPRPLVQSALRLADRRHLRNLVPLLGAVSQEERQAAIAKFRSLLTETDRPLLLEIANHEDSLVRGAAMDVLRETIQPEHARDVETLLGSPHLDTRRFAVQWLCGHSARDDLLRLLGTCDANVDVVQVLDAVLFAPPPIGQWAAADRDFLHKHDGYW